MTDKIIADAMRYADEFYKRQNMRHIDDDDYPRALREMDVRNIQLRLEYERRKRYGFTYPDYRGEVAGAMADAQFAAKLRLAKYSRNKVEKERLLWKWRWQRDMRSEDRNVVSIFHRPQAG